MTASWDVENLVGVRVRGADGIVLGVIEQVFDDDATGMRRWVGVRGEALWDGREHIVPLRTSTMADGTCCVPYTLRKVSAAPSLCAADRHITREQEVLLRAHYGIGVITTAHVAGSSAEE